MSITYVSPAEAAFWNETSEHYLKGIRRGLEKESLRITQAGTIAQTPHPIALGSALTNQYITTDYSEALLEFITPATDELNAPLQWLENIHHFVYQHLDDELLWATSMPCVMGEESSIPLAYYGTSNSGRMKTIYREGLGYRYGRFMQTIAGVHYNFSLSEPLWQQLYLLTDSSLSLQDFKSERYMGMIRNFQRNSWIIPLIYGASPALCESFLKGRPTRLDELVPGTRYGKFATSLRMSDLGYQNNSQSQLKVCLNELSQYIKDLEYAIRTEDPYYKSIGVKVDGHYRQLNANILQIENEYYSNIRPKRTTQSGERPTKALRNRGIEYIEVRALDINPFSEIGVDQQQLYFLDVFLLHCLMQHSPPITERETAENKKNFSRVVKGGRDPELYLWKHNKQHPVRALAHQLFDEFELPAALLDKAYGINAFSNLLSDIRPLIDQPNNSLSGQVVDIIEQRQDGFFAFAYDVSKRYADNFKQRSLSDAVRQTFEQEAARSIQAQHDIEENDRLSFEEFLAQYYAD
jgi:glutamate--cysteine ligase